MTRLWAVIIILHVFTLIESQPWQVYANMSWKWYFRVAWRATVWKQSTLQIVLACSPYVMWLFRINASTFFKINAILFSYSLAHHARTDLSLQCVNEICLASMEHYKWLFMPAINIVANVHLQWTETLYDMDSSYQTTPCTGGISVRSRLIPHTTAEIFWLTLITASVKIWISLFSSFTVYFQSTLS